MPTRPGPDARRRPEAKAASRWLATGRGLARLSLAGLALAGLALAGCAHGPRQAAAAPADVVFNHTDPGAVSAMIASQCRTMGWSVDGASAASVTCTASVTTPQRILSTLTMRNTRRQTKMASYHFMLSWLGSDVRVRTESWFSDPDRGQRRALKPGRAANVARQMTGFLVLMGGHLSRPDDAPGAEP